MKGSIPDKLGEAHGFEFTPGSYKQILCQYLEALGNDLILDNTYSNNLRGQFVLNIRHRLLSNFSLTKKQKYVLSLIETELAKQLVQSTEKAIAEKHPPKEVTDEKTTTEG